MKYSLILSIALQFVVYLSNAQHFSISIGGSYNRFVIESIDPSVLNNENDLYNGFEIGLGVDSKIGKSIMSYSLGMGYSKLYYKSYSLSFAELPAIINFNLGNRIGVIFGGGLKLRYLLNEPDHNREYYNFERILLSYCTNLGLYYNWKQFTFKLYPEIEFFQSRLFYSTYSPSPGYKGEKDYYLSILSVKFKCLF